MSDATETMTQGTSGSQQQTAGQGDTAQETGKWLEQASPEHRGYDFLKGKPKIDDLILHTKGLADQLTQANEKLKAVPAARPAKDATPEQIAEWRKASGLPPKAEDIKFDRTGFQGAVENKEMDAFYQKLFYDHELSAEKADAIWKGIYAKGKEMNDAFVQGRVKSREAAVENLKKALGQTYETTIKVVAEYGKARFGNESWKLIEESGLGNQLDFIKPLFEEAQLYQQGRFIKGITFGQTQDQQKDAAHILFPGMK